jgi:hypothetical protein
MRPLRIWKAYIIFLLFTLGAYPKIACACLHQGNSCYLSLPFGSPFVVNFPVTSNIWALSEGISVLGSLNIVSLDLTLAAHFGVHIGLLLALPLLSYYFYTIVKKSNALRGFFSKNGYVPFFAAWLLAALVVLVFDFMYSMYIWPLCIFGIE